MILPHFNRVHNATTSYDLVAANLLSGGFNMNYSRKNTISQQKNDGQSYSLGITQSSGLDRLSGYPDKRSHGVGVQHRPSQTTHLIPTRIFLMCCTMRLFGQMARSKTTSLSSLTLAARIRTIFRQFRRRSTNWTTAFCSRRIAHGHIWDSKRKMMQSRKKLLSLMDFS